MRLLARSILIACVVLALGAAGCRSRAHLSGSSAEPRDRALAHLLAAGASSAGGCRRGFVTVPGIERACFRS